MIIGYARVSTEKQGDNGVSLDAQQERIYAYCKARGWEAPRVWVEVKSASTIKERPVLSALLEDTPNTLIVTSLDRLTRSVHDLAFLLDWAKRNEVTLVSITQSLDTSSASGRLMLNVQTSVSQWEREVTGERTKAALDHKKANGKVYGPTPYGFSRVGDDLIEHREEQEVIASVLWWREAGTSYRDIIKKLSDQGWKSRSGGRFATSTLKQIVDREGV